MLRHGVNKHHAFFVFLTLTAKGRRRPVGRAVYWRRAGLSVEIGDEQSCSLRRLVGNGLIE